MLLESLGVLWPTHHSSCSYIVYKLNLPGSKVLWGLALPRKINSREKALIALG